MKKSESENNKVLENWLDAGRDKAPASLKQKVMAQVEVEPLSSIGMYSAKINKGFKIIAVSFIVILSALAVSLPSANIPLFEKIKNFKLPEIRVPELSFSELKMPFSLQADYILALLGIIVVLFVFDRFLNRALNK